MPTDVTSAEAGCVAERLPAVDVTGGQNITLTLSPHMLQEKHPTVQPGARVDVEGHQLDSVAWT